MILRNYSRFLQKILFDFGAFDDTTGAKVYVDIFAKAVTKTK